jgi:predicted RecB family nuclease
MNKPSRDTCVELRPEVVIPGAVARNAPAGKIADMLPAPRLSKSRYITGLQCSRRLWLGWHDPEPHSEPEPGSILAIGTEVGVAARRLAPSGVLVAEGPREHEQAVEQTKRLLADPGISVIFEAAFAFDRVLIRADVLERLPSGAWKLSEVKSTTRVKPEHLHDLAVQAYVIIGSGFPVEQMELVHVDTAYVRGDGGIDWPAYFKREDVTSEVRELLPTVPGNVAEMHTALNLPAAPLVRPSGHCFAPFRCEFWSRCTAEKPTDWIIYLPHLRASAFVKLDAAGIESIRDIPPDFPLAPYQKRVVETVVSGREVISPGFDEAMSSLTPPAAYLDFETFAPALPLYPGTCPYQRIPFQWSMHHDSPSGLVHSEFLATGKIDPRREFADTLLRESERVSGPMIVYSGFEASVLRDLASFMPDLRERLLSVINRLRDLLPIVRRYVSHPQFLGSYSLKTVAPALVSDFTYADLDGVAQGTDASTVFYRLATNPVMGDDDQARDRAALLAYCRHDTLALLSVHRRLLSLSTRSNQEQSRWKLDEMAGC